MKQNYLDRAMKATDPRFAKIARRLSYQRRDMTSELLSPAPSPPIVAASGQDGGDSKELLRAEYVKAKGKKPFMGWDAETLRKKIAE